MKAIHILGAALVLALPTGASAERLFGLTSANNIVTFNSTAPGTVTSSGAIAGLAAGDTLLGLDLRPANRELYSLSRTGNIYLITKDSVGPNYTATITGSLMTAGGQRVDLSGNRFGVDFNPVPDRLRVLTDFDQNLRINVDNGVTIVDGTLSGPGSEAYVAGAYTNNRAGATTTMLYALDASGNQLSLSSNPNAGTYNDIGVVRDSGTGNFIDFGGLNNVGFDISGRTGAAFFSNGANFFSLDLQTAEATRLGTIGSGSLVGLTVAGGVPEPATWAMLIAGFGAVGASMRVRRVRQTANA